MNARIALLALATVAASPAFAGNQPVEELARQSGLSERRVQMLLGNRTSYAEYRYTYDRSLERLVEAIGEDNYQRLVRGEPLAPPQRVAAVDVETKVESTL